MQLELRKPAQKWSALLALISLAAAFVILSSAQLLAFYFSQSPDPTWIRRAVWLDRGNAEARYNLGNYELLMRQSPQDALPWLRSAAQMNSHNGRYWIDLASAQEASGDGSSALQSLHHALAVDPHTPQIAWEAANLFLAQGDAEAAMKQFHTVLANDSSLTWPAIRTCWKIRADPDYLLANVVPPAVYPSLLEFFISKNETEAARKVWQQMFSAQQSVKRNNVFEYVRYLIIHHQVEQAARVWQEAAGLAGLEAYQPSSENLLVNGDFSLEILNGGFDWVHFKISGVALELDPTQAHSSSRSLRITFDGPGINDAGISQVVAVEPSSSYEFSAFYKAEDMDGAGGMEFAIQDAYSDTPLLVGEDLRDADFWKKTGGSFTTAPDTRLVAVRLVRVPAASPIRGKLWIDGLQLIKTSDADSHEVAANSDRGAMQ